MSFTSALSRHPVAKRELTQRARATRAATAGGMESDMDLKSELLTLLEDEELQREVRRLEGKPMRGRIDEMIVAIERTNEVEETAYSYKLDGDWKLLYSASVAPGIFSFPTRELALLLYGGVSLGNALSSFAYGPWGELAGLQVLSQRVSIDRGRDVRASAEIEFLGQMQEVSYSATMDPLTPMRFEEQMTEIDLPPPIGAIDLASLQLDYNRELIVTYLDDDIMIVRDATGSPEVLVREYVDNYGFDESYAE